MSALSPFHLAIPVYDLAAAEQFYEEEAVEELMIPRGVEFTRPAGESAERYYEEEAAEELMNPRGVEFTRLAGESAERLYEMEAAEEETASPHSPDPPPPIKAPTELSSSNGLNGHAQNLTSPMVAAPARVLAPAYAMPVAHAPASS